MQIWRRLFWVFFERIRLRSINVGAHISSFVNSSSILEGPNRLGKGTHIINSRIGRHTYVVNAKIVDCTVGNFCSIGQEVLIGGLGRHPTNFISSHPVFYSTRAQSGVSFARVDRLEEMRNTTIGHDVWIGARVIVMSGVNVGHGAIIGAGSVVTKNVPPYAIVGGVPAKIIRMRFDEETIGKLTQSRWWDWSDEMLKDNLNLFSTEVLDISSLNDLHD